ncbi:MAG: hypothetical protein ACI8RA_001670 [Chlamydiales bacterium]|jgi:hypothetical protein
MDRLTRGIIIPTTSLFLSSYLYKCVAKTNFGKRFFKIKNCSDALDRIELILFSALHGFCARYIELKTSKRIPTQVEDLSYLDHYKREKPFWAFKTISIIGFASYNVLRCTRSNTPVFAISMISLCCLSTDGLLTYMSLKNNGFVNGDLDNGLYFDNYPELRSLPRGLRVSTLLIEKCPKFTTLPEDIQVDGDIQLDNCRAITSLPENLRFGGNLSLFGCRGLTSLPENITRLGFRSDGGFRLVNLTGTGLSDEYIDRLRNEPAPGMQFYFGREHEYIPDELSFNNLSEAINFWKEISPREAIPNLNLEGVALTNMLTFLDRLANTAEYRNIRTQQALATRVLDMISFISQDEEIQEKALDLIGEGLISCDDRIIATLDDIELLGKIQEAERESPALESEAKLRSLGEALYKLEEVRKYARRHMANLNWVDEVEVQLAFQIGLTDRLQLPLSTQNMIFRACANVSDQQITDAGEAILRSCTERNINQFLQSWDPWKRYIRRKIIPDYESLNSWNIDQSVQCEILHEVANKPVQCKNNVFDYEALCKVYIQSGQNPCTREPINWSDVKRLQT